MVASFFSFCIIISHICSSKSVFMFSPPSLSDPRSGFTCLFLFLIYFLESFVIAVISFYKINIKKTETYRLIYTCGAGIKSSIFYTHNKIQVLALSLPSLIVSGR